MGGKYLVNGLEWSSLNRPADSELFSGPHSGTFFCKFFVAFPGNSSNNADPDDPTKFVAFPENSANNADKNPDLAFSTGAQKKVPESAGLVGGPGPSLGPAMT